MRLCLVLPPLTQVNTPYPSISYLARHLREKGIDCEQRDLGIELFLRIMSPQGLGEIFDELEEADELPEPAWVALALREKHEQVIGPVIRFLQGRDRSLAHRMLQPGFLPTGPQLERTAEGQFGRMAQEDSARYRATLYLKDLVDLIRSCLDTGFELNRYQHHLSAGVSDFDDLAHRLEQTTLVDAHLDALSDSIEADVVGLSVPFPGNFYGALRIGRRLRARGIQVLLGGGYVNTELRDLDEPRLWDFVDALFYDDGEGPLIAWLEERSGGRDFRHRTRTKDQYFENQAPRPKAEKAADYSGLDLSPYLQIIDSLNPAHRLWSDGRWNKITLAHGCYWKRCEFCDIQLDYISRYEPARIGRLLDQVEAMVEETGDSGFHMVDEAAPPKLMIQFAEGLIARGLTISWWGNIRFEPAFTPDVCRLLSASGLIAVTGGLEVASDRLLEKMDKGITVDQVVQVASAFSEADVMVHAYLMYGFPTQTHQEAIDAMEIVRQLFVHGLLDSGFWHRFVLTKHSGVIRNPASFDIDVSMPEKRSFSENDLVHVDRHGVQWEAFDEVLPKSLRSWMQGDELHKPVEAFFDSEMPATTVAKDRVASVTEGVPRLGRRWIWLGGSTLQSGECLVVPGIAGDLLLDEGADEHEWVMEVLDAARAGEEPLWAEDALSVYPGDRERFEGQIFPLLRRAGLLQI